MHSVYFVGYLKSPFISQNRKLLKEDHKVVEFDLSLHASSFSQVPEYFISVAKEWKKVYDSEILWVWFADYPAVPFILLSKVLRKPIIINVGGWEVCGVPEYEYGNQLSTVRGAITRWILRNTTTCICMSEGYKQIIRELEPSTKVYVIPGWIDTSLCNEPLPEEKTGILTAFCTYPKIHALKGIPTFEAATIDMQAGIVSDAPHKKLIEALKNAKVYCQLSLTESFGVTLLEAMACGCVPVVSNHRALPEVVGQAGVIVPFGDVQKTAEGIRKALNMSGEIPRQRAAQFSKAQAKTKINELIQSILG